MENKTSEKEISPEIRDDSIINVDTLSLQSVDWKNLARIRSSIDIIQDKIDHSYNHLCKVLPEINIEIYKTFKKASDTLDFLNSEGTTGKIDSTLTYMENLLETVNTNVLLVMKQDSRIYEVMDFLKTHFEVITELEPDFSCTTHEDQLVEIQMRSRELLSIKDELINNISMIKALEESVILDIDSHIHENIKSLEHTLSSVIFILKDLIKRSGSTKKLILNIISSLQTHDIVNQDINNISHALSRMQSLGDRHGDQKNILEEIFFHERVSLLSSNLIDKLLLKMRNHGSRLSDEIDQIENVVIHVKEDKDTIADFLLLNEQKKSTLDIVSLEISQILDSILSKLEKLTHLRTNITTLFSRLVFSVDNLEKQMSVVLGSGCILPETLSYSFNKIISGIKYLNHVNNYEKDFVNIEHLVLDYMKAIRIINFNLENIKALFIESAEGIDIYSQKCMESITMFRQDIKSLFTTLDGSDPLLNELKEYSFSISSIRQIMCENETIDQNKVAESELNDILYRLENPHCNTLRKLCESYEEGMTFF